MATAITTKGDLVPGTGSGTFTRLGVGTNGQTLVAASGEATGLKWATPSQVLLNTTTFSAVSSQSVNDVFSSTYAYYRLYFSLTANSGSNASISLAMRVSAADTAMAGQLISQYDTSLTGASLVTGVFAKTHSTYGSYCRAVLDIVDPNTASVQSAAFGKGFGVNSSGQPFQYDSACYTDATTQFTGFTITPSTGTMSGTLRVYGVTI
jgi:hypothetical protein